MSRIVVIGGTGYAGSAIVAEAAARGHEVTAFSRSLPAERVPDVTYVQGDATDEAALASALSGADVVVGALAPRGPLAGSFRDVYRTIGRLADAKGAPLYVVGGFSSLRPAGKFGSYVPGERLGEYRVGDDVAVQPEDGGAISGADYALGFVDLIEKGDHHRAHVNLAY